MKLYVGIDVSSKDMKACLMDQEGATLQKFSVDNNFHGASYLRDQIVIAYDKGSFQAIQIGLEATSFYSWHPAMFFHEDPALRARNTKVFTINPKLIRKFKEAYVELDKNDHVDAWRRSATFWTLTNDCGVTRTIHCFTTLDPNEIPSRSKSRP